MKMVEQGVKVEAGLAMRQERPRRRGLRRFADEIWDMTCESLPLQTFLIALLSCSSVTSPNKEPYTVLDDTPQHG